MNLPNVKKGKLFQQIDIMPTMFDLLGLNVDYYSFGSSYFNNKLMPKMICEQGNLISFDLAKNGLSTIVWNEQMKGARNSHEQKIIRQMKALYQHYTHDLITNRMTPYGN